MVGINPIWSAWRYLGGRSKNLEQHWVAKWTAQSRFWKLLHIPNNTVKCQLGSQLTKPWLPHLDQMRKGLFLQAGRPQGPLPTCCLRQAAGRVRRRWGQYLYTWTGCKWPPGCRSHLFKNTGGEPGRYAVLPFRVFPSGIGRKGDSSHRGSPAPYSKVHCFAIQVQARIKSLFWLQFLSYNTYKSA